jgi:hypothetical protein
MRGNTATGVATVIAVVVGPIQSKDQATIGWFVVGQHRVGSRTGENDNDPTAQQL